ncbi:MAG: pyrroloquinoline quinone biosynthesis peptide chaperone PqqD [Methylophilaceae bacterium]|jgi:pyrroloquinoline quinone biosynthesis protein D|nr:MAG: pyrroloquinoline quinone biosynthesis peptide chaperone PqqD [Methylophilaceae bacterium]
MSVNQTDIYAIALHHRFQWEEAQSCYVILFPEGMVKLNGGAGEVLNLVDGKRTVADIVLALTAKFSDVPDLAQDIIGMLDLAIEKAWLRQLN